MKNNKKETTNIQSNLDQIITKFVDDIFDLEKSFLESQEEEQKSVNTNKQENPSNKENSKTKKSEKDNSTDEAPTNEIEKKKYSILYKFISTLYKDSYGVVSSNNDDNKDSKEPYLILRDKVNNRDLKVSVNKDFDIVIKPLKTKHKKPINPKFYIYELFSKPTIITEIPFPGRYYTNEFYC